MSASTRAGEAACSTRVEEELLARRASETALHSLGALHRRVISQRRRARVVSEGRLVREARIHRARAHAVLLEEEGEVLVSMKLGKVAPQTLQKNKHTFHRQQFQADESATADDRGVRDMPLPAAAVAALQGPVST